MQTYVINLERRPDRLRNMESQLGRLELPFEVVSAVDAQTTKDSLLDTTFAASGPLGPLPKGDKCCTLSHMMAWRAFLASGDSHALVLEDDIAFDSDCGPLLRDLSWVPAHIGLLKIERFGPPGQRVLLDGLRDAVGGRQIGRLRSRHTGAGAYILTRKTAETLLAWDTKWTLPVDHMLFNPNNSPLAARLEPWQLTPVIARQSEDIGGKTDIGEWRRREVTGWKRVRQKIKRGYYECRLLPMQIASLLTRSGSLVRVDQRH